MAAEMPLLAARASARPRSEEHTSELQSLRHLVCRLLLEKKKKNKNQQKRRISKQQQQKMYTKEQCKPDDAVEEAKRARTEPKQLDQTNTTREMTNQTQAQ